MKASEIVITTEGGEPTYYRVALRIGWATANVKAAVLAAPVHREERGRLSARRDGALVRVEQIGPWESKVSHVHPERSVGLVERDKREYDVGEEHTVELTKVSRLWTDEDEERLHAHYAARARAENAEDRMVALGVKAIVSTVGAVQVPLDEFERLLTFAEQQTPEALVRLISRLCPGAEWQGKGGGARQKLVIQAALLEQRPVPFVVIMRTEGAEPSALGKNVTVALDALLAAFEPVPQ